MRKVVWIGGLIAGITGVGLLQSAVPAEEAPPAEPGASAHETTAKDLAAWVQRVDATAKTAGNVWEFTHGGRQVVLVFDEAAGRMRIMTAAADVAELTKEAIGRALQANFDTALDARYAVAHGVVWSAFIHPLPTLDQSEFFSGLQQVVNAADTFGTTYSSGGLLFKGGDSAPPSAEGDSDSDVDEETL